MPTIHPKPNKPSHRDRGRGDTATPKPISGVCQRMQDGILVRGTGKGPNGKVLNITHKSTDGGKTWLPVSHKHGHRK